MRNLGINKVQYSRYNLVNPQVKFLENNRIRFQVELTEDDVLPLAITLESGLSLVAGRQIQLVEPAIWVNGEAVPSQFVSAIATNISKQLELSNLERYGLGARLLKLKVSQDELEIAAFLRVEPSSRLLQNRRLSMY